MNIFQNKNSGGYTLVETILYIAFFSVIMVIMMQALVTALSVYQTSRAYRQVAIDGNLAMERMVREIRQASSVNDGASSFGVNPGVLTLNSTDSGGSPVVIKFWVNTNNGEIQISENNVLEGGVTSGVTHIDNLMFTKITTANSGVGFKIDMTVRSTYGVDITAIYHDTALMRGTY